MKQFQGSDLLVALLSKSVYIIYKLNLPVRQFLLFEIVDEVGWRVGRRLIEEMGKLVTDKWVGSIVMG